MRFAVEVEQEDDGRSIAEIDELHGVLVYGNTKEEAIRNVETLALNVLKDRFDNRSSPIVANGDKY